MSRVLFNTSCHACGRKVLARIQDLGAAMRCPHCRGRFIAREANYLVDDRPSILHGLHGSHGLQAALNCNTSPCDWEL